MNDSLSLTGVLTVFIIALVALILIATDDFDKDLIPEEDLKFNIGSQNRRINTIYAGDVMVGRNELKEVETKALYEGEFNAIADGGANGTLSITNGDKLINFYITSEGQLNTQSYDISDIPEAQEGETFEELLNRIGDLQTALANAEASWETQQSTTGIDTVGESSTQTFSTLKVSGETELTGGIKNTTGNLVLENTNTTGKVQVKLGSTDSNTDFEIIKSDGTQIFNVDSSGGVSVPGSLTTGTHVDNTTVTDLLMELGNGRTGTPSGDGGIVIERGDQNNAFMGFDESADKFIMGTGTFTGATSGDLTIITGTLVANLEGNVTGNISGSAATVTGAAQTAITSVGTLTALQVDNINVDGNTITASSGALNLTPASGSAIVLDGTINVDAGVVTGATSITSTAFVGALTGNVTGNTSGSAATVTGASQTAITSVGTLTSLGVSGDISITGSNNELRFYEGSNYVGFEAPSLTGDQIWVLPTADGSDGQFLKTNGSGTLSWATASGGGGASNLNDLGDVTYSSGDLTISSLDTITYANGGAAILTVAATSSGTPGQDLTISAGSTTAASGNTDGGDLLLKSGFADGTGSSIIGFHTSTATSDDAVAERMRIHTNGNVGIGTVSPMNKLQLSHTAVDGNNGLMIVREDTVTGVDDFLGGIGFDSTDGNVPSSVLEASAGIGAYASEHHGTTDKGGYLTFWTSSENDDDDTAATERMRITDEGNVGIGDTDPISELSVGGKIALTAEQSTPTAPSDGNGWMYTKEGGDIYWQSFDIPEVSMTTKYREVFYYENNQATSETNKMFIHGDPGFLYDYTAKNNGKITNMVLNIDDSDGFYSSWTSGTLTFRIDVNTTTVLTTTSYTKNLYSNAVTSSGRELSGYVAMINLDTLSISYNKNDFISVHVTSASLNSPVAGNMEIIVNLSMSER